MEKIIIHLIGEQIRNQVLMLALEKLGFDCTVYTLNISEVVLTLMGFRTKSDELYQQYFEMIEKAVKDTTYLNMDDKLVEWSERIYAEFNSS